MYLGFWWIDTIIKFYAVIVSLCVFVRGGYLKNNKMSTLVLGYILYCLITGVSYFWIKQPISCYFADISDFLLPILFFYVGLKDINDRLMYDRFLMCLVPIFILGIICYITTPGWYTIRLAQIMNSQWYINSDVYDEETVLSVTRFTAFFRTSYPVSHFVIFGLAIAYFDILRSDKETRYNTLCVMILILVAFLSQHRVAIACMALFLLFTIYSSVKKRLISRMLPLFLVLGVGSLSAVIYGLSDDRFQDVYTMVSERVEDMSVSNALKERKQIHQVMSSWDNIITGQGIGSGGATARAAGFYGITDQNYIKLLYETGVLGCLYLSLILWLTILRGVKYYKYYLTEMMIIVFILIAMLGSNSLVIYYTYTFLFWYAVGRIWNQAYLQKAIINEIKI